MKSIVANTWRMFHKNKELIYLVTVQSVLTFLMMSFLLPYTTAHNIAVVNMDKTGFGERVAQEIEQLEGVNFIDTASGEVESSLMAGNIEVAVIIGEDSSVRIESLGGSEVEGAVRASVDAAIVAAGESGSGVPVQVNDAPEKGITIANSLGFMIFKTLTSGNLLAALIILERNRKMKDRILLSGTGTLSYLGGMALVYLLFMMLGSLIYYLAALVLNFDFGMRNSLGFLLMLFAANALSTALYLFASSVVKKEDSLWFFATFILFPMGLFSGILFPFEFMPPAMQAVGSLFPQRWICAGIEAIQQSGSVGAALPELGLILGLSAVLLAIAVVRSRPKTSQKQQAISEGAAASL